MAVPQINGGGVIDLNALMGVVAGQTQPDGAPAGGDPVAGAYNQGAPPAQASPMPQLSPAKVAAAYHAALRGMAGSRRRRRR